MDPIALTQVAAMGVSVLAGAVLVKQVMETSMMDSGRTPRCPVCNGSGRVKCLCSRWSDGDAGCRTCHGSVRMTCGSCGGTRTGSPISVRIHASRSN
ncbi:hypothetical protein SASPL_133299 [Salvia splendens]|uniref:Uncharacterized protein n=1 Tax=Salvia splendens TaxID=180675 RepID=A0A8X8ZHX7_SALSN|nr:hypothetical protein SASPL_133299 [Salvia splendens]